MTNNGVTIPRRDAPLRTHKQITPYTPPSSCKLTALLLITHALLGCSPAPDALEEIEDTGQLKVSILKSDATGTPNEFAIHEFELAIIQEFSTSLNADTVIDEIGKSSELEKAIRNQSSHLAIGTATKTKHDPKYIKRTPPIHSLQYHVVTKGSTNHHNNQHNLQDIQITLTEKHQSFASHHELIRIGATPNISKEHSSEELLMLVADGEIDYTIVDSLTLKHARFIFPELSTAFTMDESKQISWLTHRDDLTLQNELYQFIDTIKQNGRYDALYEEHFGHLREFDYVGAHRFLRHIKKRLPKYLAMFQEAGKTYELDWRLLAAVAYQESHWDPNAVSPTGVKGIMMLTLITAKEMGVKNRTGAGESIDGGARYLKKLMNKVESQVVEEDQIWVALAAYNAGYGHIQDARLLAQKKGLKADSWPDIKRTLPLLQKPEYYKKTKHGYSRGAKQALHYVDSIRRYYSVLKRQKENS